MSWDKDSCLCEGKRRKRRKGKSAERKFEGVGRGEDPQYREQPNQRRVAPAAYVRLHGARTYVPLPLTSAKKLRYSSRAGALVPSVEELRPVEFLDGAARQLSIHTMSATSRGSMAAGPLLRSTFTPIHEQSIAQTAAAVRS